MASRYWVGGTATWDATAGTKWAATSGGAGGQAIPTAADDVFFDAASGAVTVSTSGTLTDVCRSLDCTGFTGTLNQVSSSRITIGDGTPGPGNVALKLSAGMTYTTSATRTMHFVSTSATQQTIDFAGKLHASLTFNAVGGSYILSSATTGSTSASITLVAGTLDTNSQTCSWFRIISSAIDDPATLTLGASSITLSGGTSSDPLSFSETDLLTLNAGTSVITCTGGNATANLANLTFYDLVFTGAGETRINGTNPTCRNFTRTGTATKTDSLFESSDITCTGTYTVTGNSAVNRMFVYTSLPSATSTITAAAVSLTNADFMDIEALGAAVPFSGTSIGDCGGNTGFTFTTPATQTRSGAGGNWSAAANWTSRVPLPQDDVVINASATGTITGDMPRAGRDITFTGFTGTYTSSIIVTVYGSVTYASGMTLAGTQTFTYSGRSSHTITTNGKTVGGSIITAPGGTYSLSDNYIGSGVLRLNYGTFDSGAFNVSMLTFDAPTTGGGIRTLNMGSGTWSLTSTSSTTVWTATTATNLTLNPGTSTIVIATASTSSRSFSGGGRGYYNLTYNVADSPGSLSMGNFSNTFNTLTVGPGRGLIMTVVTGLVTVNDFIATGVPQGYISLYDVSANYASAPDSPALSITGDIDLRYKGALNDWSPGTSGNTFIAKRASSSTHSYTFEITSTGLLTLLLSTTGSSPVTATSSAAVPFADGADGWVRATWKQSDGTVQFFTSTDGSIWTQLGIDRTIGLGSIFDGTSSLEIGSQSNGSSTISPGKLYRAQIRNNILDDGTGIVFDADFTTKPTAASTFTESSSNGATVTINGPLAQVGDGSISITSNSSGTTASLSKASGIVSCDYLSIKDSTATGGAAWYAGSHSVNVSNNTGWIFSDPPAGGGSSNSNFLPFFKT